MKKLSSTSRFVVAALIPVSLAVTLITCQQQEKQAAKEADLTESAVAVRLAPVTLTELSIPVQCAGLITTEKESRLSFKIGGLIARIYVSEGDVVKPGQLLATLDLTEIDAQVAQAKNALDKAQRDFERGQRLYRDSAATLEQMQNLTTAYDVAREAHKAATFNKTYASIHATAAGRVLRKLANEGELAGPGTPVLVTNATAAGSWVVKSGLTDVDWVRVQKGDMARIRTDAYGDAVLEGEVVRLGEGADPYSGLYPVEIAVRPGDKHLASGLFAHVEIVPAVKRSYRTVPVEAIIEGHGHEAYVFVAEADGRTVRKIPVTVAQLYQSKALITSGLDGVDRVIAEGPAFLTASSTIRITE